MSMHAPSVPSTWQAGGAPPVPPPPPAPASAPPLPVVVPKGALLVVLPPVAPPPPSPAVPPDSLPCGAPVHPIHHNPAMTGTSTLVELRMAREGITRDINS